MDELLKLAEELQDTLSKETFNKFTSSADLHYLAQNWSWETKEEIQILRWICESECCSQATAFMIFWFSQPHDYMKYKLGAKVQYDNGIFEIIQIVLKSFEQGVYQHHGIHYDPCNDMPNENIEIDERMKKAVQGEETWYDEDYIKKIAWYVPSELESEIKRANMDYLNMIANGLLHFRDAANTAGLIIQNPNCDIGTALLLYWRLLLFYFMRGFSPIQTEERNQVVRQLREKLLSDNFSDGICYDPLNDKENDTLLGKQKKEWEIPKYMKQAV